nr:C4-dicarboxylate ABC transporter [Desulfofarcimen acetoxidans]
MAKSYIIQKFSPSWFACVMGTGIVAVDSYLYAEQCIFLKRLAIISWVFTMLFFLIILIPWVLRFMLYKKEASLDFKDAVTGQFYATMPIACLVIAVDLMIVGIHYMNADIAIQLAKTFWLTGVLIALPGSIIIPLQNFINQDVKIENINPAWFMPPVSLIVIPVAGTKLIPFWPISWQQSMLVFNYISWSGGFFLFLILEVICIYRFICCPLLPGKLAPTVWINLGPIGVGTISLINLGTASVSTLGEYVQSVLNIGALFLWGFGFWWLMCALVLTSYYLSQKNLPFSLSWWAFTFPLGAYTGATYLVSTVLNSSAVLSYGYFCLYLLLTLWFVVLVKTIKGVIKSEVFL